MNMNTDVMNNLTFEGGGSTGLGSNLAALKNCIKCWPRSNPSMQKLGIGSEGHLQQHSK